MAASISPDRLKQILNDGREFALLDVRERGCYARGHLFLAINLPLSRLELHMRRHVPRHTTRVLLCDDGNGFAPRAARVLEASGYDDVSIVDGGVRSYADAGFALFRGHYAAPYAFGLYAERWYRPPRISPARLKEWIDSRDAPLIVDSRTDEEFLAGTIPGAVNVPLGELAYRIRDLVPDTATPVVVSCGAVTRGVIGAESLIEAGIENPVYLLGNGVRGWEHEGFPAPPGVRRPVHIRSPVSAGLAVGSAGRVAAETGVHSITPAQLDAWRADPDRTLYLVDVRTREEYEAGHLHDAVWIPGGELIGLYEDHIGTMNARMCLVDDDGARATIVASWLTRMGWPDVAVLDSGMIGQDLATGFPVEELPELQHVDVANVEPEDLSRRIESDEVLVLDFAHSSTYAQGHIPGAWWASRSALPDLVHRLPASGMVVTTCPDGRLARLAANDLSGLTSVPVAWVAGGTAAWRGAEREVVTGLTRALGEIDDVAAEFVIRDGDDPATARAARRRMLEWQEGLLDGLERDRTFSFPDLPSMRG